MPAFRRVSAAVALVLATATLAFGAPQPASAAARPSVTGVSARSGIQSGGITVTVTGSGFSKVKAVFFGTAKGTNVRVISKTRLKVTAPPRSTPGVVAVRVKTKRGLSAARPASRYTYVPNSRLSTTGSHSCLVTSTHKAYCWGYNAAGQVGNGTSSGVVRTPARIAGAWSEILTGGDATCGVRTDRTGWCWGGLGTLSPQQIPGLWKTLVPGAGLGCGIKADLSLWCWGVNGMGQVGVGSSALVIPSPTRVGPATATWRSVVNATTHACAIRTTGQGYCWGDDSTGAIGNAAVDTAVNAPFSLGTGWTQIDTGSQTCGVQSGVGRCWGDNYYGAVGNGATGSIPLPTVQTPSALVGGGRWQEIRVHELTSCGIRTDGVARCWGYGGTGGLGAGPSHLTSSVPLTVSGNGRWASIELGQSAACGRRTDFTLWCWGLNSGGTLGDGTVVDKFVPTPIAGRWSGVDIGSGTTCAARADNSAWCWGRNHYGPADTGAVGDGLASNRLTPYRLQVVL